MSVLCRVEFVGKDGQTRQIEIEASSLFDAANQAMQAWSRLWWFNYQDDLTVVRGRECLEGPAIGCSGLARSAKESTAVVGSTTTVDWYNIPS